MTRSVKEPVMFSGQLIDHIEDGHAGSKALLRKKPISFWKKPTLSRFGYAGNIFAMRVWKFNSAEESTAVQDCRCGSADGRSQSRVVRISDLSDQTWRRRLL